MREFQGKAALAIGGLFLFFVGWSLWGAIRPIETYLYHPGDVFFTDEMERPFRHIVFRVGEIGEPRFEVGDQQVDFKQEVGFGGQIILDVRPVRVYEVVLARLGIP